MGSLALENFLIPGWGGFCVLQMAGKGLGPWHGENNSAKKKSNFLFVCL